MKKCARLLSLTLDELAVSCAIPPSKMRCWLKSGGKVPGHVALLFYLREQEHLKAIGLRD